MSDKKPAMSDSLYRQQALLHAGQRAFGRVMIKQPLTLLALTFFVLLITVLIIAFLKSGEYARKVTVTGYLKPEVGISGVYPSSKGIVEALLVKEGVLVSKDQALLRVRSPHALVNGDETAKVILNELLGQKFGLGQSIVRAKDKHQADYDWRTTQLAALREEQIQVEVLRDLQTSRVGVMAQQLRALITLKAKGHVSNSHILQKQAEYLSEQKDLALILKSLTRLNTDIKAAEHQVSLLPLNLQDKLERLKRELSELNQRITEAQGRSEYLIKAPLAGRVTAINVGVGEPLRGDRPLLSIVPVDAPLFAWLQVPSRAAGFTKKGQTVRLMFDSFPFQQFGTQAGTIVSIAEVAQGASFGAGSGVRQAQGTEPVYLAKVKLQKAAITAFGEERPLQVDMLLSADIVQAKRSIFDWMVEPLYTLRGRTH